MFVSEIIPYCHHSHTKRNSLHTRTVFIVFRNISTMAEWSFTDGTDISNYLWRAWGWRWHRRNLTFLNNTIQYTDSDCNNRTIRKLTLQLLFLKYWRIIQKTFLIKIAEKDTKHRSSRPAEVFCKVDILENFVRFTEKMQAEALQPS